MARYLLDTGILVGYLRASPYADFVEKQYSPLQAPNISAISIVSVAELRSLALQFQWGQQKRENLDSLIRKFPLIDINHDEIFDRYAEMDAFSLGKDKSRKLPSGTPTRKMGKNDIWIAATASVIGATLLTADKGFAHLDNEFLTVIYVDPASTP
jgi:tRNA(fMet)-specific endonuclease VapC